jgi:hypothetical protein
MQRALEVGSLSALKISQALTSDATRSEAEVVRWPPWSLQFRSSSTEAEFLDFTARPWYGMLALYVLGTVAAASSYFLATPVQNGNNVDAYVRITRPVFAACSAGCLTFCFATCALLHLGEIPLSLFNRWNYRLQVLFQFMFTLAGINFAVESRDCAVDGHDANYIATCFRSYNYNILIPLMIQIFVPTGFDVQVPRLALLPFAEFLLSVLPSAPRGQPAAQMVSRPFFAFAICASFGSFYYVHEKEDRERFLFAKRLQELTFAATARKEQIAGVLDSLTTGEQLNLLLSGDVISDVSTQATILISMVDSFQIWRQKWLPRHAVSVLGNLFEALEQKRIALKVERIAYRGDQLITAVGLKTMSVGNAAQMNTSGILMFATMQRFLCKRLAMASSSQKQRAPVLRWGIGHGECRGFLVPGSVVYYMVMGPAMVEAKENLKHSPSGVLEVQSRVVEMSSANVIVGPSSRGKGIFACIGVAPRTVADHLTVTDLSVEATSIATTQTQESGLVNIQPSSVRRGSVLQGGAQEEPAQAMQSLELSAIVKKVRIQEAAKSQGSTLIPRLGPEPTVFLELFRPAQPEGFGHFQEELAVTHQRFSVAVWFTMICIYLSVFLLEDDLDLLYGLIFVAAFLLLFFGAALPLPSVRWGVFVVSLLELGLLTSFFIIRQNTILTVFVVPRLNILFLTFLVAGTQGVHPLLTAAIIVCHGVMMVLLIFFHPGLALFRDRWGVVMILATFAVNVVTLVNRARHSRRVFDTLSARKELQRAAVSEKDTHEKVLRMLLPHYVVPLVAKRQEEGKNVDVVMDHLPDVAVLFLSFNAFETWQDMLQVAQLLDGFTQSGSPVLHLIHADGDHFRVGGPLRRDLSDFGRQAAVSLVAGKPLGNLFAAELAADVASLELARLVGNLLTAQVKCVSVLHRGDGLAAVFGYRRPSFALLGPVAEAAQCIVDAVSGGPSSNTVTLATFQFAEMANRCAGAWAGTGVTLNPAIPIAIKGLGKIRAHPIHAN